MQSAPPPPNPSLVAIILIVRSREGSRFVFHYPESPQANLQQDRRKGRRNSDTDAASSSSDSDDDDSSATSDEEGLSTRESTSRRWLGDNDSLGSTTRRNRQRPDDEEEASSPERNDEANADGRTFAWDTFFSLHTRALESLLGPNDRSWHKRRFEVGLNDLCFIGWPVFVREDGTWQKKKHKHKKKQDALEAEQSEGPTNDDPITTDGASIDPVEPPVAQEELPEKAANMRMFNIVFVLNPPILEYSLRVKEMYDNITKKFAKALKWEQAKSGYVWKEAKLILKLKDKARENRIPMTSLYKEILEQSSLARAIASIYVSISASKIAGPLMLTQDTQPTLQIPPVTSISVLPALTDPPCLPGLWLTTANSINDEHVSSSAQAHSSTSLYLAKHFALLLLDNESTIVKDIMASAGPLAPELVRYIRASHPTKSFAKVSVRASISLNDIRLLADHLVYWRRARAITPLHQRDTYIVSPNADMRRLPAACKAYEVTFPALPSLPNMLAALSGPPRPYGTLIPSKDHKEAYFQILAWLLRGGWVTQLRTFAWIRVDKDVKLAVDRTMKEERKRERSEDQKNGSSKDTSSSIASSSLSDTSSFHHRPSATSRSFSGSQASSHGGTHHSSSLPGSTRNASPVTDLTSSSLILTPIRASPLESAYLVLIGERVIPFLESTSRLSEDELAELQHYFPIFAKEMDGSEALEKIPIIHGMKRLKAWEILNRIGVGDPRVSVDDGDTAPEMEETASRPNGTGTVRKRIVVSVRHW